MHRLPTTRVRRRTAAVAAVAALTLPGAAAAGDSPPNPHESVSSVSQYVEDIPTSSGPAAAGRTPKRQARSTSQPPAAPPPPAEGTSPPPAEPAPPSPSNPPPAAPKKTDKELEELVTSPALGAPTTRLSAPRSVAQARTDEASAADGLSTAVTSGSALLVLLLVLAGITAGAVALVARRAR